MKGALEPHDEREGEGDDLRETEGQQTRAGRDPTSIHAGRTEAADSTVNDRARAFDLEFERLRGIQVHADALPVRAPLQNLAVRSPDAVASLETRARADGIWLHVRDDHRARLEQRYEPERRDPEEVARDQQRQIPDVRDGHDRNTPTDRGRRANSSARRHLHFGFVFDQSPASGCASS